MARHRWILALAAAFVLASATAPAAQAATLTVTTTADSLTPGDGKCSLREAIEAANSPGSPSDCGLADALSNTIVLGTGEFELTIHPSGEDDQTTGDLDVNATAPPLTITGAGAGLTIVSAKTLGDRAFHFVPGSDTIVENLTISGAHAPDGTKGENGTNGAGGKPPTSGTLGFPGGGIRNGGRLTLLDVAVTGNTAGTGGIGGTGQTLEQGAEGGAAGSGGGILNDPTGELTLTDVTVSENTAGSGGEGGEGGEGGDGGGGGTGGCCGDGGGLENDGGTVTITGSTFSANHAGAGGAGGKGAKTISSPGLGGNGGTGARGGSGGAIASTGGTVTVTDSTLSGNGGGPGGVGGHGGNSEGFGPPGGKGGNAGNGSVGGAVFATGGATITLLNVTVDANTLAGPGTPGSGGSSEEGPGASGAAGQPAVGGGVDAQTAPAMKLTNTLLGTDQAGNCAGQIEDGGDNLTFGAAGCAPTFIVGDPKLGPLQANGGPTETMALGAGSAAMDRVPASGHECPPADQRGVPRPGGAACDIGAYEVAAPRIASTTASAITKTSATLKSSLAADQVSAAVVFEYGQTAAYGSTVVAANVFGVAPETVSVTLTGLKAGTTYHFRVAAVSSDGTSLGPDAVFTTAGGPRLSGLKLSRSKFRLPPKHGHAQGKTGTKISYSDSATATTRFVVFSRSAGTKKHGRCVRPHRGSPGHRCTLLAKVTSFSHSDQAGADTVGFDRHLAPGRYVLEATPRAGGETGATVSVKFTVI